MVNHQKNKRRSYSFEDKRKNDTRSKGARGRLNETGRVVTGKRHSDPGDLRST